MNTMRKAVFLASVLIGGTAAQGPMTAGVSVQMASASRAVEMPAADEPNAKVVAITAEGKVYLGVKSVDPQALSQVAGDTIYLKFDARAPFQKVLAVLDALHGRSVVLLTAPPAGAARQGYLPPYGVTLVVPR